MVATCEQRKQHDLPTVSSTTDERSTATVIGGGRNRHECHRDRLLLKGTDGERYLTRYQIDLLQQANHLCRIVLLEDCVPCCDSRKRRGVFGCVWSFIRSEVFIYLLHFTSIFLGALKEAAGLRQVAPLLSVVDSSFETLATLLLIVVRMGNAYFGYREVQGSILHDQITERDDNIHVRLIKRWMIMFNVAGLLLFSVSLTCFLIFLYELHLGWTLLSNNFSMITIQVFAGLYRTRVTLAVTSGERWP